MAIILSIFSLILNGYLFYLLKQLIKKTNTEKLDSILKDSLYLLDELETKVNELDTKVVTDRKYLLQKLENINQKNQRNNTELHKQLVSEEFKNLKSSVDETIKNVVKSVENIKII
tara:strand:+ start:189 stop:536 length:348 start_codon:yes stop_codon:yes gene_type:complete